MSEPISPEPWNKRSIRTSKSWHGNDQIVVLQLKGKFFEDSSFYQHNEDSKRFYLIADSNQASKGFRFSKTKPGNLKNPGMAANVIRKHLPSSHLEGIIEDKQTGDYWALFSRHSSAPGELKNNYIHIKRSSPPELSFITTDGQSHFRIGKKGSFTKKATYQDEFPDLEKDPERWIEISSGMLSEFFSSLEQSNKEEDSDHSEEDPQDQTFSPMQRDAKKRLTRRIKTVKKSIASQQEKLPTEDQIKQHDEKCRLLQQFSYLIKPNMLELTIDANTSGLDHDVVIELPDEDSSGQVVNDYFVVAKKMKKSAALGQAKLAKDQQNLANMMEDLKSLQEIVLASSSVESILLKYKIPIEKPKMTNSAGTKTSSQPYKTYRATDGSLILVGKSSAENDVLTKQAKSNDYWFHTVGITGSHIVIPYKTLEKKTLTEGTKKQAAILAIHFSKIRADLSGELYFTRKQHLKKKKNMPVGLWAVEKSETYYAKYTDQELKEILERLVL